MIHDPLPPEHLEEERTLVTELVRLSASNHDHEYLVRTILSCIEKMVQAELICLSIGDAGEVEHYVQAGEEVDPLWREEAGQALAAAQESWLMQESGHGSPGQPHRYRTPLISAESFLSQTRSGRCCALGLGGSEPMTLTLEQERRMARVTDLVLLVLDHALALQQMEQVELQDSLTGLANHRRLLQVLNHEIRRHQYFERRMAVMLVDIEGLNRINRSYGHHYGNHILQKLAGLIRQTIRPVDMVARYRLDEFVVVLPETDHEEALMGAERLWERLRDLEFAGGAVEVSIGVVDMRPDESLTPESLLRRAEGALYEAKRQGRDWSALWAADRQRAR